MRGQRPKLFDDDIEPDEKSDDSLDSASTESDLEVRMLLLEVKCLQSCRGSSGLGPDFLVFTYRQAHPLLQPLEKPVRSLQLVSEATQYSTPNTPTRVSTKRKMTILYPGTT